MKKTQILSADFETTTLLKNKGESTKDYRNRLKEFNSSVYAWAICERRGLDDYKIVDGISIFSFIDYFEKIKKDVTMYFHNGSKFDVHFLIPFLGYKGYKQLIFKDDNLSDNSQFNYEEMELYEGITFEEKFRKLKSGEYSMLVDGSHKVIEMKIALKSKKRKRDGSYENRILVIRDSNLMFPSNLAGYGDSLNQHYKTSRFTKLELQDGYLRENLYETYDEFVNDKNEREYLHKDVVILSEFLYLMADVLPFHKWKMTAAGTSYSIWKNDFLGKKLLKKEIEKGNIIEVKTNRGYINYRYFNSKKLHPQRFFVNKLFDKMFPVSWLDSFFINGITSNFNFIHTAYQGGLTMANPQHAGKIMENIIYVDIKSSYPTQMKQNFFPYGLPTIGDDKNSNSMKLINLEIVNVKNETGLPFMFDYIKINKGKHYPKNIRWKDYLLTDIEFERFKKYYKGDYKWDVAVSFNKISGDYIFGEYIDFFYSLKSKENVSVAERIYTKLMLNALYGKFGQDITRTSKLYLDNHWVTIETISDAKFSLPIAIWITSYGRMYLVDAVGNKFSTIGNLDTDALSIKIPLNIYKSSDSIIKKYIESNYKIKIDSKKLGYWEIEQKIDKAIFRRAKQYMFINNKNEKILKFAGLRLNKVQLQNLSFKEFIIGKEGLEQLRPFRTPTGLVLESYDKKLNPIWNYDLNPDYWFKDEKSFMKKIDIKTYNII